jgi:REP element-mobilizing transposase RayT
MPRIARIIAPGVPHHITQRGNRRMETFFCDEDYQAYLALMAEWCRKFSVSIWCYCLLPNHVHLIAVPETAEGFRRAIWRGASPLLRYDQSSAEMDRSSVAGSVFLVPDCSTTIIIPGNYNCR